MLHFQFLLLWLKTSSRLWLNMHQSQRVCLNMVPQKRWEFPARRVNPPENVVPKQKSIPPSSAIKTEEKKLKLVRSLDTCYLTLAIHVAKAAGCRRKWNFFSLFCLFPWIVLKASATSEQPAPLQSVCLKYNERAKSSTKENLSKEEHDWMRRRMPSWKRTYFLNIAGCCYSEWLVRWDWHSYPPTSTRKSFLEMMNLRCSASNHPFRACQCSIDGK